MLIKKNCEIEKSRKGEHSFQSESRYVNSESNILGYELLSCLWNLIKTRRQLVLSAKIRASFHGKHWVGFLAGRCGARAGSAVGTPLEAALGGERG